MLRHLFRACQQHRTSYRFPTTVPRIAIHRARLYAIVNATSRKMASVALEPVHSTATPASNPAIQSAIGGKKSKAKKGEQAVSAHPLEVHRLLDIFLKTEETHRSALNS